MRKSVLTEQESSDYDGKGQEYGWQREIAGGLSNGNCLRRVKTSRLWTRMLKLIMDHLRRMEISNFEVIFNIL